MMTRPDDSRLRQFSLDGHQKAAELINAYIDWQICEMEKDLEGKDGIPIDSIYPVAPLPKVSDSPLFNLFFFRAVIPETRSETTVDYYWFIARTNPSGSTADRQQLLTQKYVPGLSVPPVRPTCHSMNSERNKLVPLAKSGW